MRFATIATAILFATVPVAAQDAPFWQGDELHAVLKVDGSCSLVVRTADNSALAALVQENDGSSELLIMSPQPLFAGDPSQRVRLEFLRSDGRRHGERVTFETRSGGRHVAPISNAGAAAFSGSRALRIYARSEETPIFEIEPDPELMVQATAQMRACLAED